MTAIKHFYNNYQEAIHVAANRDEIGMYESKTHPFVFINGYVLEGGRLLYNQILSNIKDGFVTFFWCDFRKDCIAYFDHKHKKVAIKANHWYTEALKAANPWNNNNEKNNVFLLSEIPVENIFDARNKNILAKERAKVFIERWIYCNRDKYKVLKTRSKIYRESSYFEKRADESIIELQKLMKEYPNLLKFTVEEIFDTDRYSLELANTIYCIQIPTISDIIDYNVFNNEETRHIEMCKFYTEYCYNERISWSYVKDNWGTPKIADIKDYIEKRRDRIKEYKRYCEKETEANRLEALNKAKSSLNIESWRESIDIYSNTFKYEMYFLNKNNIKQSRTVSEFLPFNFKNVELKLNSKKDHVITSKSAIVPLDKAIQLFNMLYDKYISKDIKYVGFEKENIQIEWYCLRHICYRAKKDELGNSLGYCDWCIQIGCHAIWMEEVKEFCRYYHLEDKVHFSCEPLKH